MQMMEIKNKTLLSYAEYGDKTGYPILIQHGTIASILDHHLFNGLLESGAHLICMARPGYGESAPYTLSGLAEWGELVSVLVNELKLPQFDVLGISSGAPYSYAIGSELPKRVRKIFIFSGTPALYHEHVLAHWPYPANKQASHVELERVAKAVFFPDLSPEDLTRNDIRDSTRNNCFGVAQDLRLRCMDWGFDLSEVGADVYMEHGRSDDQVPFITAELTAHLIPNCRLTIREGGGHYSDELLNDFIRRNMVDHDASTHA